MLTDDHSDAGSAELSRVFGRRDLGDCDCHRCSRCPDRRSAWGDGTSVANVDDLTRTGTDGDTRQSALREKRPGSGAQLIRCKGPDVAPDRRGVGARGGQLAPINARRGRGQPVGARVRLSLLALADQPKDEKPYRHHREHDDHDEEAG